MSKGHKRPPTTDELNLWKQVTESVAPLGLRNAPLMEAEKEPGATSKAKPPPKARPAAPAPRLKPVSPKPPPLSPLERRMRSRVTRGGVAIDARVDLHGLTQGAAHARLNRFLREAQADGAKLVLVITGKGKPSGDGHAERGVLRRIVPAWLSAADMRMIVIGFDEAGPTHGGTGALYVRIRRERS